MKAMRILLFVCVFLTMACSSCVCIEDIGPCEFEVVEDTDCNEDCRE